MKTNQRWLNKMTKLGLLLMMGVSMSACSKTISWKEEVQLHDGSNLIVERSQSYGGRHEIGQSSPIKEHTITFTLPNSNKTIKWTSEYSKDVGRANFNLLALHVLNGTPYIVAEPNLCLSYNKWGRPNPPYVIFKHDGKDWQRIQLSEFPAEFKAINLIINNGREEDIAKAAKELGYVSAESVKGFNSSTSLRLYPQYKTILREAMPESAICPQYPSSPKAPIPIAQKALQTIGVRLSWSLIKPIQSIYI
jgi:hypothetical protein